MATAAKPPREVRVGNVAMMIKHPYTQASLQGFKDELARLEEEFNIKITHYWDTSVDPGVQLDMIETMLGIPVDIMEINSSDGLNIRAIKVCNDAGIPVICRNANVYGGTHPYAAMGNFNAGESAAKALLELFKRTYGPDPEDWVAAGGKDGGVIFESAGPLGMTQALERHEGFHSIFDPIVEKTAGLQIVIKPYDWEAAKCYAIAQDMYTRYGDSLIGVFDHSDTGLSMGVVPALKAAGAFHKVGEPGHVPMVGIDGGAEALEMIRQGEIDATIVQDGYGEGRAAGIIARRIILGEPLAEPGDVLYADAKPQMMRLYPEEYGPEYAGAIPPWAPITVIDGRKMGEGKSWDGIQYRTSVKICPLEIPADSKLLWGNFMHFLETGKWPWE